MGQKMIVRGIVSNAAANAPVDQAVVQILASIQTTQTDASGRFVLGPMYIDCGDINYIQVDKSGYYHSRVDYVCDSSNTEHTFYVFPSIVC